jgi:CDP-diacylglycerol--serine O-phosphatidyltransferase
MADNTTSAVSTVVGAVRARTGRSGRDLGIGRFLGTLTGADYLSLLALLCAWISALLLLDGAPNRAVLAMFVAFAFDKLDGYYARRAGVSSPFGRQVDSFIDVFTYLVTAALLVHVAIAPHLLVSAVVGFAIIAFGGLRLVRHNHEGFLEDENARYYRGTTVVHTNVVVVVNYLLVTLVAEWSGWLAVVSILLSCPLMISDYRTFKTAWGHVLVGAFATVVSVICLHLAVGLP